MALVHVQGPVDLYHRSNIIHKPLEATRGPVHTTALMNV